MKDPLDVARQHMASTPYELLRELGRGGMGTVFLARHRGLGRQVVVKLMHLAMSDSTIADRMRLEAQALARLRHPNVVEVLDFGRAGRGRAFLAMEHLEGQPLDAVLAARGWLPLDEALHYAVQACDGLVHVHRTGVIHRDVKPANLFVLRDGCLKLLDFGVVKLMEAASSLVPIAVPTAEGAAVGTPKYMAPEQAAAADVDGRVDVYAVGTVLYEMLAGRSPFEHHRNMADMMIAQATETPLPPSRYAEQPLPEDVDALVMRAIEKRRRERYPSAAALAEAIRQLQEDLAAPARRALRQQRQTDSLPRQIEAPTMPTERMVAPERAAGAYGPTGTVVEGVGALHLDEPTPTTEATTEPLGPPPVFSPPPGATPPPALMDADDAAVESRRAVDARARAIAPPSARRPAPASRRPTTDRRTLVVAGIVLVALSVAFGWLLRDVLRR